LVFIQGLSISPTSSFYADTSRTDGRMGMCRRHQDVFGGHLRFFLDHSFCLIKYFPFDPHIIGNDKGKPCIPVIQYQGTDMQLIVNVLCRRGSSEVAHTSLTERRGNVGGGGSCPKLLLLGES